MKLNFGIRRRLAPLLDYGRPEIELMVAMLFSLPGSPILYYGDEIGMGDNIYLGDCDGVRTPMQWSADRNGHGFSRADFAQLYLPPLMDPVSGYQAVNVEAELRMPTSLLLWMRRFIALRKEHPVFGLGSYETLPTPNPRVFAHIRRYEQAVIVCVHNLSRAGQVVQLDLAAFAGAVPVEMLGRSSFPAIGELPYLLTLAPRGFYWFELTLRSPEWPTSRSARRRWSSSSRDSAGTARSRARSPMPRCSSASACPATGHRARSRSSSCASNRARASSTSCSSPASRAMSAAPPRRSRAPRAGRATKGWPTRRSRAASSS